MITAVRTGKIVYSQACWLIALYDLSSLLSKLGRSEEANRLIHLADKSIHGVEQQLWYWAGSC